MEKVQVTAYNAQEAWLISCQNENHLGNNSLGVAQLPNKGDLNLSNLVEEGIILGATQLPGKGDFERKKWETILREPPQTYAYKFSLVYVTETKSIITLHLTSE